MSTGRRARAAHRSADRRASWPARAPPDHGGSRIADGDCPHTSPGARLPRRRWRPHRETGCTREPGRVRVGLPMGRPGARTCPVGPGLHQSELIQYRLLDYDRIVTAVVESTIEEVPPPFVRLLSHPVRWRLLRQLVLSDRTVHELAGRAGEAQNLVSYHLRSCATRASSSARRSSADGRDTYYTADLTRVGTLLTATATALHPGLGTTMPSAGSARPGASTVLFLCTGNSARSQIGRGAASGSARQERSRPPARAATRSRCTPTPSGSSASSTASTSPVTSRST